MVATETEAAPAESTGPTVNIQTTEAAKAEPASTTAELAVKTMSAEPAEGELDYVVVLQKDISGSSLGDPPADPVGCKNDGIPGTVPSSEQLQQRVSVDLVTEKQPVAAHVGLDESLSGSSAQPESAGLTLAAEKENEEVIDEQGEDAGVDGEALTSKDENDGFRFTVAPAYIGERDEEEKPPSAEEERDKGEAVASALEALEEELAGFKEAGERKHTEVDGKRVQFSDKVQYFVEQELPAELEDGIEDVDEERDEYSPAGQKTFPDILKPLPSEKEKYYYVQMDSSEDEMERTEEEEADGKKEELEDECDEEEPKLKMAEDCVDEKASEVREDVEVFEEVLEKGEIEEQDQQSSEVTLTGPLTSDAPLTHPLPPGSQSEVTLHQLQWLQPGPCNLTSTLPSCRHNLPLIIKGKPRPQAWTYASTC